ncbi:MAG: hypothetical protein HS105_13110 [Chloracidobacterium sp.]|nr:hypothetical protein [Chloracidobacterium sp.]
MMDPDGKERTRLEGYLTKDNFHAYLMMGLARVAFTSKDFEAAEKLYAKVAETMPDSQFAAEAVYWKGVCVYKATGDASALGAVTKAFKDQYSDTIWAEKSIPWG